MTVIPFNRRTHAVPARRASDCAGVMPAVGYFHCPTGGTGAFGGSYRLDRLFSEAGKVVAVGVFTGELVDARGSRIGLGSRRVKALAEVQVIGRSVVAQLEPLEVNLLGFVVAMQPLDLDLHASLCSVEDARALVDGVVTTARRSGRAEQASSGAHVPPALPAPAKDLLRRIVSQEATPRGVRPRR